VLVSENSDPFQIGITATQLTFPQLFTAMLRSYNFASPGYLERFNLLLKGGPYDQTE
jgi:hypothetical protein